jgi:rhodanese-related sulfurtransferase
MKHTLFCSRVFRFAPALLGAAAALCVLAPAPGFAQQPNQQKKGAFIDGEYVEDYVFVPDFMSPEDLKKAIDEHSTGIVIVDTAAPPVWEDEHIPGASDFPYNANIKAPVPLPRDKTLVIYCACKDHEDSSDVARQLTLLGYRNVKVLKGGWFKWVELKYKTESKDEKPDEKKDAK